MRASMVACQPAFWFGVAAFLVVVLADTKPDLDKLKAERLKKVGSVRSMLPPFFNLGENPLLWENDILSRVFEGQKAGGGAEEKEVYVRAGNIAAYVGLSRVEEIHLPLPINLIFVGFNGDANGKLKVEEAELNYWFEHLDHVFQHTRMPIARVQPLSHQQLPWLTSRRAEGAEHGLPLHSPTYYNVSCHVLGLGPAVAELISEALKAFSRPVDPRTAAKVVGGVPPARQVDVRKFEALLDTFLSHLDLDDAYNIFVLNPLVTDASPLYGYRWGYSAEEAAFLAERPDVAKALADKYRHREVKKSPASTVRPPAPLYSSRPQDKFLVHDKYMESEDWVDMVGRKMVTADKDRSWKNDAQLFLHDLEKALSEGDADEFSAAWALVSSAGQDHREACLLDMWMATKRYAFIDLSAGPFEWGPMIGGGGLRTKDTIPRVENAFRHIRSSVMTPEEAEMLEEKLESELQSLAEDRFAQFGEQTHDVVLLAAELDVYELFAEQHCKDRKAKISLCEDLADRVEEIKGELLALEGSEEYPDLNATGLHARSHGWDIFGGDEEAKNVSIARDLFMSELGAVLATTFRLAIAPSTYAETLPFRAKVSFHMYIIRHHQGPELPTSLDVELFKEQVNAVRLPNQEFQFAVHRLDAEDDPALAMALASSLRSNKVPKLSPSGMFSSARVLSLDSKELQGQLRHLDPSAWRKDRNPRHDRTAVEVPIFILSTGLDEVFIDKYYQALPLSDMVLAVQSGNGSHMGYYQCNGGGLTVDLRQPVAALVSATLQHIAGLLPSHLFFSLSHQQVMQNFMWSVGRSPQAYMRGGAPPALSQLHIDSARRGWVVSGLDLSIAEINRGIDILLDEHTDASTFDLFTSWKVPELLGEYSKTVALWKKIVQCLDLLDFARATSELAALDSSSRRFHKLAKELATELHPVRCTRQRPRSPLYVLLPGMGFAIFFVGAALWGTLRPRKVKPKIN